MNKIFASVGLVAVGAASVHAQYAPGLTPLETAKPWAISADLRGFYDDNYLTLSHDAGTPSPRSSWGFEVSPSASFNHSTEDTLVSGSYVYDARYYTDSQTTDQSHQVNLRMDHEFSKRYKLALNESFVVAQEPTIIDPTVVSSPLRTSGNNIRNTGQADFTAELTKEFDLHLGYANTFYAYKQLGGDEAPPYSYPSRSADLDRMEQLATIDLRWKIVPETTGVFGYQYGHVNYTSPEYIITTAPYGTGNYSSGPGDKSNIRNDDEHFAFVGADEQFNPDLNGSIRVGAEYLDYYNAGTSKLSPYADASLTYQYMPKSSAQLGVKEVHNSTDVTGIIAADPVLDEQSTAVYLNINHQITDRFTGSLLGQAQWSTFNGGGPGYNGQGEDFYIVGLNFAYHFNPWLLTEAGYDYSKLNSDIYDRSYTRNQVYLGFRATY